VPGAGSRPHGYQPGSFGEQHERVGTLPGPHPLRYGSQKAGSPSAVSDSSVSSSAWPTASVVTSLGPADGAGMAASRPGDDGGEGFAVELEVARPAGAAQLGLEWKKRRSMLRAVSLVGLVGPQRRGGGTDLVQQPVGIPDGDVALLSEPLVDLGPILAGSLRTSQTMARTSAHPTRPAWNAA
jgi:hypothetical protein